MDLHLKDAICFVTGGSSGIGRATALALAFEGARVAISYHSNKAAADEIADRIATAGGEAYLIRMELDDLDSVSDAVRAVVDRWGGLDAYIGNAVQWGTSEDSWSPRVEDIAIDRWQEILRANLEGNIRAIQVATPALRRSRHGRVVFVSSSLAERGMPGSWHYGAAKAGLRGLVAGLTPELGQDGVLVNLVMAGITLDDGHHNIIPHEALPGIASTHPAGRLATVDDVAAAITFLSSPRNGATTGETVRVNGGDAYAAA